ncbi:MAG TPA: SpoIIE family protein phosphatase [Bacteroidia bacterium]|nr:SpoIIE family protein phosphatase [Bacteroidia bacterium]
MRYRFTIGRRIGLGFAILISLTVAAFTLTIVTIIDSKYKTETMVGQVTPSVTELKELNLMLQRSHTDISKWIYNKSLNDQQFRDELRNIIKSEYPKKREVLNTFARNWTEPEKNQLKGIFNKVDTLFQEFEEEIMLPLNSLEAYEDASIIMLAKNQYEDLESHIMVIYSQLSSLISVKKAFADNVKEEMYNALDNLAFIVKLLSVLLMIGGVVIGVMTTRSITKPVQVLKKMLLSMGLGILPEERVSARNDEIGEMGNALNDLIQSMHRTTDFAKETGAGNFNASYTPLSKDDTLGHALLMMRDDLAENERVLEQKVIERTEEVVRQKSEIEHKNVELEILYKQVTDSIHYAKRIQDAILPTNNKIKKLLPDSFILFKPKDIVSGDFYWIEDKGDLVYFAAVDCTGHGVPGAFMSLVGYNILRDILKNTPAEKPSEILDKLRDGVMNTLRADESGKQAKDGMDMTLCAINYKTMQLQYAAAFNPLYVIRKGELIMHPANKFPIGSFVGEKTSFDNHEIQLQPGDQIFIFSDGYADQFGGPTGKKFMVGNFRKLLLQIAPLDSQTQKEELNRTLVTWQGEQEQVDDVLVIGVKV